jgi:hypothetical protein
MFTQIRGFWRKGKKKMRRSDMLIMWTQRTRIMRPKKRLKIMVIWIQMARMMAILGSEVHVGERTVAPMS